MIDEVAVFISQGFSEDHKDAAVSAKCHWKSCDHDTVYFHICFASFLNSVTLLSLVRCSSVLLNIINSGRLFKRFRCTASKQYQHLNLIKEQTQTNAHISHSAVMTLDGENTLGAHFQKPVLELIGTV